MRTTVFPTIRFKLPKLRNKPFLVLMVPLSLVSVWNNFLPHRFSKTYTMKMGRFMSDIKMCHLN